MRPVRASACGCVRIVCACVGARAGCMRFEVRVYKRVRVVRSRGATGEGSRVGGERQGGEGGGNRYVTMTLCQEYEACVGALSDFRKAHMRIAVSYLSRTATGTGSSSFKEMLATFSTDTRALLKREGPGERTGGGGELAEAGAGAETCTQ